MKLSKFKEYIINILDKGAWKNFEQTYGYQIYSATEEEQKKALHIDGTDIRFINNPSEELQLVAVQQNGLAIEYIKNPSEKVQLEAVKENGLAIEYIKKPSEEIQLEAVRQYTSSIEYIENPSEKVIQETVMGITYSSESIYLLKHIENDLREEQTIKLSELKNMTLEQIKELLNKK